jgi:cobalt/nickel transport system permease protein
MHMADALLSPAVGGTMWAVSAGAVVYSSAKVRADRDDRKVPLMGVLGAFLFAAQMINFTIPATGSSGHLGGGLLLAILLGPHAAFLTIASVLVVQALFFADGGLLALGCNMFNMGFIPAFLIYPCIYRPLMRSNPGRKRQTIATMVAAVAGLQLAPFSVVLETFCSGISSLPFSAFLLLMLPIHLAIGVVEGMVTVTVAAFVRNVRPGMLQGDPEARPAGGRPVRNLALSFLLIALLLGGGVSLFASKNPDGLEWAVAGITGKEKLMGPARELHGALAALQEKTAFLPDYSFRNTAGAGGVESPPAVTMNRAAMQSAHGQTGIDARTLGTSVSGLVGSLLTLAVVFLGGVILSRRKQAI